MIFKCPKTIDIEIVQLLSGMSFDVHIVCHNSFRSPIQLAIDLRRFDIVKLMVRLGAHPIDPCIPSGNEVMGIVQLLEEYYEFGTNTFIPWLLHKHFLLHELQEFIETVANLDIFDEVTLKRFADVSRHPAHAILTCGHEEMIRKFIKRHGRDYLVATDETGRSALKMSAENGDIDSVRILVKMYETS